EDAAAIEVLLDAAFGAERHKRTAYRFRDNRPPLAALSHVLRAADGRVLGSIRFWPILLAAADRQEQALLLGPVAVASHIRGNGAGLALIDHALQAAGRLGGARYVFLIGDLPYYGRAGFRPTLPARAELPGPCDPQRLLYRPLAAAAPPLPLRFALRPWPGPAA
ncbi:MAG: N-acetyltransferase, partial [Alphaproteobacteria bacterium]